MQTTDGLLPGAIIADRYRIVSHLAHGGFGSVYVAEQIATERLVALKVLWPQLLAGKGALEQFRLEARVASRVNSDHIVQVLDAALDPRHNTPFLVMELLHGRDLGRVVREGGALEPKLALEYLRQTALGLEKAHRYVDRDGRAAPIVHRDLKPDNLFLTQRDDGSPLIKILDFGIAKVLSQSMQMSGDIKGTPLYMAYEQASQGAITPATDVWAFGLVAFYLFAGTSYWKTANLADGSITQLFGEVLNLPLSPPSERARELGLPLAFSASFDGWFARCVNRDSAERFQSVADAISELMAAVELPSAVASVSVESGALASSAVRTKQAPASSPEPPIASSAPLLREAQTQDKAALGRTMEPQVTRRRSSIVMGTAMLAVLAGAAFLLLRGTAEPLGNGGPTPATTLRVQGTPASDAALAPAVPSANASSAPLQSQPNLAAPATESSAVASAAPRAATSAPQRSAPVQPRSVAGPKASQSTRRRPAAEDVYGDR